MLSLYIHIPFCRHKCEYCSFFVLPENDAALIDKDMKLETLKEQYLSSLLEEQAARQSKYPEQQLKSIYIGGGTPFELGSERLLTLIDSLLEQRDTEFLEELTIELNPDPFDEVLDFIRQANRKYKHLYKLRFSIGIQTFDDEILEESKRNYVFNNLIRFFRDLQKIKQPFTQYNFDFIAFGKKGQENPRNDTKMAFFKKLVASHVADGYSLYTLELFPGSNWYNKLQHEHNALKRLQSNDDNIYAEFDLLSSVLQQSGYRRYEVSNFALMSKESIHNIVYRTMQSYIGLGINSSSFIDGQRFQNTKHRKKYLAGERQDKESIQVLTEVDKKTEQGFLGLRMRSGLPHMSSYIDIFEDNWQELLSTWQEGGFVIYDEESDTLYLTNEGMNVYNTIITDLFSSL